MNKIHYNPAQLRSAAVEAPVEMNVLGRALGKSTGILARKSQVVLDTMPRCTVASVCATFQQQLTRTLPDIVRGWNMLGYKQGIHFLIGEKPPVKWRKQWNWSGPYRMPQKNFEYVISWYNGAIVQMVSQDRTGSANGLNVDYIIGDEAKLLNYERLAQELFPTNRGAIATFSKNPLHHGMTFTTDMPVGTAGKWILDYREKMDPDRVRSILQLQAAKSSLMKQYNLTQNRHDKINLNYAIAELDNKMNMLRYGVFNKDEGRVVENKLVMYQELTSLENIHALGLNFFKQLLRDIPAPLFKTSVLSIRQTKIENGFYPDLDEEKHGYFAYSYDVFHQKGYDFEALQESDNAAVDADYNPEWPLHGTLDYNKRLVPLIVAHVVPRNEIRCINHLYVEEPLKLVDTLRLFCEYYRNHKNKVFYYWYDHTAVAEFANRNSIASEVIEYLQRDGWVVVARYIGQALGHERRYSMYGHLLQEDGYYDYKLRMNRDRCKYVFSSMYQTPAKYGKHGSFLKDKSTELDKDFPSLEAPHNGEALDMMVTGILEAELEISELEDLRRDRFEVL